jgi:hypothetical protein
LGGKRNSEKWKESACSGLLFAFRGAGPLAKARVLPMMQGVRKWMKIKRWCGLMEWKNKNAQSGNGKG